MIDEKKQGRIARYKKVMSLFLFVNPFSLDMSRVVAKYKKVG